MNTCLSCGSRVSESGRFCSTCGAALASDNLETMEVGTSELPRRQASGSATRPPSSSRSLLTESRFLPGQLLAGRYRIVALLGRGGMGEVYRADDLTLGQPVALKFLPEKTTQDEAALERFRNEVRIARRVSHPNVCRVYDLGEVDGHTFFTMEYVDGEDLASLLRRIGRLPSDKAIEISRQICAGLAAAHAKGVLHRDLKPANIMLDGRGQAVVTDFGLAGLAEQFVGAEVRSGTPAYMSPEQLAGKEVTEKSDVYALGLVLYEMFTGKRAFEIESLAELVRVRQESAPSRPSTLVRDFDPAVERVILRCLEADPSRRPASVLSIAAALPGGDPLAAALAAGETPSPQMVAAAGETAGLTPRTALFCLAGLLAGLALCTYLMVKDSGMGKLGLELSPEVLSQKAKDILAQLGYTSRPVDSASGFDFRSQALDFTRKNVKPPINWENVLGGRPAPLVYWYRQSPIYLVNSDFRDGFTSPGEVTESSPPSIISGMATVEMDTRGRLTYFQEIPPEREEVPSTGNTIDWNPLFMAAALDRAQFQPATPMWNSLAGSDTRAAWTGKWPGTDLPLRVEAAALHGKPVFFWLIGPWTTPQRTGLDEATPADKVRGLGFLSMLILTVVGAVIEARRNFKRGRGDRQGSFRVALIVFLLTMALWLCGGHLVPSLDILVSLLVAIGAGLFWAGLVWVVYLALEPYVRRYWPHSLISWSRMLTGGIRDPLVGRDLLFGVMLGILWVLLFELRSLIVIRLGEAPNLHSESYLMGGRLALATWISNITGSIQGTLLFFSVLFLFRVLLRREWLAGLGFVAVWATLKTLGSGHPWVDGVFWMLLYLTSAMVVFRVGFIALVACEFSFSIAANVPLTTDVSLWYFDNALFPLLSVVALAAWGFYTALGGQKLWKADAFS